jgi:hypothetical protein
VKLQVTRKSDNQEAIVDVLVKPILHGDATDVDSTKRRAEEPPKLDFGSAELDSRPDLIGFLARITSDRKTVRVVCWEPDVGTLRERLAETAEGSEPILVEVQESG